MRLDDISEQLLTLEGQKVQIMITEKLSRALLMQMAIPEMYPLAVGLERRMASEMLDYLDEIIRLKQELQRAHNVQSALARDVQELSAQVTELQDKLEGLK